MTIEPHDDDAPIGRWLSRREAIALLGGASAGGLLSLAGCGSPRNASVPAVAGSLAGVCVAKPELTEGPYFVDERLDRADIRADSSTGAARDGTPLELTFNVSRLANNACSALAGAYVDVWHCDALGVYSGVTDPGFDTTGQNWLRGFQRTDASGAATFTTIVPGWYRGRASHIHFKIRQALTDSSAYEFTSQLFFPESFLTSLYTTAAPYSTKGDEGRVLNARDRIYNDGGEQLIITPTARGGGYAATFDIALATGG